MPLHDEGLPRRPRGGGCRSGPAQQQPAVGLSDRRWSATTSARNAEIRTPKLWYLCSSERPFLPRHSGRADAQAPLKKSLGLLQGGLGGGPLRAQPARVPRGLRDLWSYAAATRTSLREAEAEFGRLRASDAASARATADNASRGADNLSMHSTLSNVQMITWLAGLTTHS